MATPACLTSAFFLEPEHGRRPSSSTARARPGSSGHTRIWWAVTTTTTVGYGDLYPTTVQGRIIGIVLMFVGIGFLSLLTASIASRFVREERSEEHTELIEVLRRIEADAAELKARIAVQAADSPPGS